MAGPLFHGTHTPLASAPSIPRSNRLIWLRRHWPVATIAAGVFILLIWMGALMCFALMVAHRI